ncbi:hypothetical protein [Paraeggerthella sp.]|uniref:hypothetical protein n=1 Tax=Paraeggerthella sp. TaxID=2897350 RepID=UPI003527208A
MEMAVERLARDAGILAYLGNRDAIERLVDSMQYLHFRSQLWRPENILAMRKIRQHAKPPL